MRKAQKNVVKNIIEAVFPANCRGCGETDGYLCERCKNYISDTMRWRRIEEGGVSGNGTVFSSAGYLGFRDEILGEIIEELKYNSVRGLAREIAELVFRGYFEKGLDGNREGMVLVPMPTSRKHVRERGFDHMDLIVKYIEELSGGAIKRVRLLERAKDTVQMGASEKVRREQAKEAVRVNSKYLKEDGLVNSEYGDKKVVLIDDVWTTGASMVEAGKKLKQAGINSLSAIAITKSRAHKSPTIRHGEMY